MCFIFHTVCKCAVFAPKKCAILFQRVLYFPFDLGLCKHNLDTKFTNLDKWIHYAFALACTVYVLFNMAL